MIDPVSVAGIIQTSITTLKGLSELLKKSKEIDKAIGLLDMREQLVEVQEVRLLNWWKRTGRYGISFS